METTLAPSGSVRRPAISNGLLGMIFFLTFEVMLFASLISALTVNKASAGVWPPLDQPRLPIEDTAINSIFLLISGLTAFRMTRSSSSGRRLLFTAITWFLGLTFVLLQGVEWAQLIGFGLTTSSSIYGAFFYLIIGVHALHVLMGMGLLTWLGVGARSASPLAWADRSSTVALYWYFVVGIWPVLYYLVYLS